MERQEIAKRISRGALDPRWQGDPACEALTMDANTFFSLKENELLDERRHYNVTNTRDILDIIKNPPTDNLPVIGAERSRARDVTRPGRKLPKVGADGEN